MGGITSSHKGAKREQEENCAASPIHGGDPAILVSRDDSGISGQGPERNTLSTPVIPKGKSLFGGLIDPRSPTQEIDRTPISVEEQMSRREAARARLMDLKENSSPLTSTPNSYFHSRAATASSATPIRNPTTLREGRTHQS